MDDSVDFMQELDPRQARGTYLVTYSQADLENFPSRETFAECAVEQFNNSNSSTGDASFQAVLHYACCMEEHENAGKHYHLALKLRVLRRWKAIKTALQKKHGIVVHFSEQQLGYNVSYRYVNKIDEEVYHSSGHPNLTSIGSPKTKTGFQAYSHNAKMRRESSSTETTRKKKQSKEVV